MPAKMGGLSSHSRAQGAPPGARSRATSGGWKMANVISTFYICTTGVEAAVTVTSNLHWQVCYTLTQRPRRRLLRHQVTRAEAEPTCWDTGKVAASPWPFKNLILHLFAPENHEDCTSKQPAWGRVPPPVRGKPGARAVTVSWVMQVI